MMDGILKRRSSASVTGLPAKGRMWSLMCAAFERLVSAAPPARSLFIEERIAIGPRKSLMLVNCAGQRFLLATAGEAITSLGEVHPCGGCSSHSTENRPEENL